MNNKEYRDQYLETGRNVARKNLRTLLVGIVENIQGVIHDLDKGEAVNLNFLGESIVHCAQFAADYNKLSEIQEMLGVTDGQ
jgi:hypothetical protein